jgi:hypothetical protein
MSMAFKQSSMYDKSFNMIAGSKDNCSLPYLTWKVGPEKKKRMNVREAFFISLSLWGKDQCLFNIALLFRVFKI